MCHLWLVNSVLMNELLLISGEHLKGAAPGRPVGKLPSKYMNQVKLLLTWALIQRARGWFVEEESSQIGCFSPSSPPLPACYHTHTHMHRLTCVSQHWHTDWKLQEGRSAQSSCSHIGLCPAAYSLISLKSCSRYGIGDLRCGFFFPQLSTHFKDEAGRGRRAKETEGRIMHYVISCTKQEKETYKRM